MPAVRQTPLGDITERLQLRKRLNCKSFQWYLTNIYPEALIPNDYYSLGEVWLLSVALVLVFVSEDIYCGSLVIQEIQI